MALATTLRTAALATLVVAATATSALAAPAWLTQDSNVRGNHHNMAPVVNWVQEGQQVNVIAQWNNWYKIQIPGQDGWVRANRLDFNPFPNNGPFPVNGGSFCINGQQAHFCINANF